jgi:hypothetical protein
VRELAHVLPEDVWLTSASAGDSATAAQGGGTAAAPAPSSAAGAPAGGPVLTIQGCARDQSTVAVTLVRLRQMQGAEDAELEHSTRGSDEDAAAAASSDSPTECGTTGGEPNYSFQASVKFAPITDPGTGTVPRRLGGGA